jgi:hypothetical protein
MNPNYVVIIKQDLDKLLTARFIVVMEELGFHPLWWSPKKLVHCAFASI